jgi:N-acetylglucosamine-6-phosphate deacetylase
MTLAPELAGALDLIERLVAGGITPAMGHTEATEPLVRAAMARGLRHATHLYNAMAGAAKVGIYRVPGALEVALAEDALTAEVIADGHHVAPTLLRLAFKAKGAARLCVVTDAMRAAGMPDGEWRFGGADGTPVAVHGGVARTLDGRSLASSVTPMDAMVRFLVQQVGLPLEQVATSASATPARVAGVDDRKGSLAAGKDADVVVLDADLRVVLTAVRGHIVYRRAAAEALSSAGGAP